MLNVIDRDAQRAFVAINDALLDVLRVQPAVLPDDADDRNVDAGKNIGGRAQQNKRREQQQQQRGHHKSVGPAQSKTDNPHKSIPDT